MDQWSVMWAAMAGLIQQKFPHTFMRMGSTIRAFPRLNLNGTIYSNVGAVAADHFAGAARRMKEAAASVREYPEVFESTLSAD